MPSADCPIAALRCDFAVPADIDVSEPVSADAFTAGPNPRIQALRRELEADPRWSGCRVTPIRHAESGRGWRVLVWTIPLSGLTEDVARACQGVHGIVMTTVPGAVPICCSLSEPRGA